MSSRTTTKLVTHISAPLNVQRSNENNLLFRQEVDSAVVVNLVVYDTGEHVTSWRSIGNYFQIVSSKVFAVVDRYSWLQKQIQCSSLQLEPIAQQQQHYTQVFSCWNVGACAFNNRQCFTSGGFTNRLMEILASSAIANCWLENCKMRDIFLLHIGQHTVWQAISHILGRYNNLKILTWQDWSWHEINSSQTTNASQMSRWSIIKKTYTNYIDRWHKKDWVGLWCQTSLLHGRHYWRNPW